MGKLKQPTCAYGRDREQKGESRSRFARKPRKKPSRDGRPRSRRAGDEGKDLRAAYDYRIFEAQVCHVAFLRAGYFGDGQDYGKPYQAACDDIEVFCEAAFYEVFKNEADNGYGDSADDDVPSEPVVASCRLINGPLCD